MGQQQEQKRTMGNAREIHRNNNGVNAGQLAAEPPALPPRPLVENHVAVQHHHHHQDERNGIQLSPKIINYGRNYSVVVSCSAPPLITTSKLEIKLKKKKKIHELFSLNLMI